MFIFFDFPWYIYEISGNPWSVSVSRVFFRLKITVIIFSSYFDDKDERGSGGGGNERTNAERVRKRKRLKVILLSSKGFDPLTPKGALTHFFQKWKLLPLENILSSSRGCGVHPTVAYLLKTLFLWLQASFCIRSGVTRLCRQVNIQIIDK